MKKRVSEIVEWAEKHFPRSAFRIWEESDILMLYFREDVDFLRVKVFQSLIEDFLQYATTLKTLPVDSDFWK
jgi:hypothetical protein